jgi:probable ribosomal RNA small subunit methyltransferase A
MRNFHLDQNFLRSPKLALFLIGHSNIKKRDLVIDIGAGSGVITSALAKRCKKVIAVEKDAETAKRLRENLTKQNITNVEVFEGDFREMKLPDEPYKVFANPPFSLSAEVFYKLLNLENLDGRIYKKEGEAPRRPEAIYLILQKQLALKLIITERHYTSQLGRLLSDDYATRIRLPLKPTDFTPPPKVPTVLFEAKKIII